MWIRRNGHLINLATGRTVMILPEDDLEYRIYSTNERGAADPDALCLFVGSEEEAKNAMKKIAQELDLNK